VRRYQDSGTIRIQREESSMRTLAEEREQARKPGHYINRDARSHLKSPYSGKIVGILRVEVITVTETLDEMAEALDRLEPDPQHRYCMTRRKAGGRTLFAIMLTAGTGLQTIVDRLGRRPVGANKRTDDP
jgi:hypothetical protein